MRNRPPQQFLSRAEAAEQLGCSLRTVSRHQRSGRLRSEKRSGRTCILHDDVVTLKREPVASQGRLDKERLRQMSARVMMLEMQLKDIFEAFDRRFAEEKPTSEDF